MYWLTVDPGEETGFAVWKGSDLIHPDQDKLWPFLDDVDAWLTSGAGASGLHGCSIEDNDAKLGAIICEDWQIYPWEAEPGNLNFDKCRTARGIGALELLARQHNIPIILQPASIKEGAEAAGARELFVTPQHENRHMNDAIMHGVFYLAKEQKPPC